MILIQQSTVNRTVFTLNEAATTSSYVVLFSFINDTTGLEKLFYATDISYAQQRFNMFEIEETTSEDFYNGKVSLKELGYWSYTMYEMVQTSPLDFDKTNAISELEIGKVFVKPLTETLPYIFTTDEAQNNVTYE